MLRRVVCSALLTLAPLGVASAQALSIGTGTGAFGGFDMQWEVACRTLTAGTSAAACDDAGSTTNTYYDAALVTVAPSGWAILGNATGGTYISRIADASLRGGVGNELANFEYTYRTRFDLGTNDPNSFMIELARVRFDNYWTGFRLNGGEIQTAGLADASGAAPMTAVGTDNWSRDFSLTVDNGFQTGVNTLELIFTGNGLTDGLYVEGQVSSLGTGSAALVTPEPGTWLLTASGLVTLAAAARRRRAITA